MFTKFFNSPPSRGEVSLLSLKVRLVLGTHMEGKVVLHDS